MFENNEFIQEINFTNFNTSLIKNMEYMFKGCSGLRSLDLSNFNTSSVTSMASMFKGCSSLKSLDLSNFDTSSVTSMASMFSNCYFLAVLDISNFVMNYGINGSNMFEYLANLRYISLINTKMNVNLDELFSSFFDNEEFEEGEYEIIKLLVCKNDPNIPNIPNSIEFCCEKNNNSFFCKTDNYITIKYKEDTDYPCGFGIDYTCAAQIVTNGNHDYIDEILWVLYIWYDVESYLFFVNRELISFINIIYK